MSLTSFVYKFIFVCVSLTDKENYFLGRSIVKELNSWKLKAEKPELCWVARMTGEILLHKERSIDWLQRKIKTHQR